MGVGIYDGYQSQQALQAMQQQSWGVGLYGQGLANYVPTQAPETDEPKDSKLLLLLEDV